MKAETMFMRLRTFFMMKKVLWSMVVLIIIFGLWFFFGRNGDDKNIQVGVVKKQDIEKTVLTTGQVVSSTDLNLSLQSSGVVRQVLVKEGGVVYEGQTLVVLDQSTALANLKSAEASLAQTEANYKKILAAATEQDIAVSQASLDSAITSLSSAKQNLIIQLSNAYNTANTVVLSYTNSLFTNPQGVNPQFGIYGTVNTNPQLVTSVNSQRLNINSNFVKWQSEIANLSDNNLDEVASNSISYLSVISNYLNDIISLLSTYTQVTSGGSQTTLNTYLTGVVSGKSSIDTTYTSVASYSQSVKSAQAGVAQAQATLSLKKAPARPEDVEIAKAQVLSAEGAVNSAQAVLNNTVLRAPANGTITQVDIKIGEQAQAQKVIMKLLNVGDLYTEALVSEADIASIMVGQEIDNTFDALGPDKHFKTKVLTVNPASTIISGVVNYKITGSLEKISEVKPGMTANMTIKVAEKKEVLVVPSSAVINKNGGKFVKLVTDSKTKEWEEIEVQTGLEADGGLVEILSGLTEGQEVITFIK